MVRLRPVIDFVKRIGYITLTDWLISMKGVSLVNEIKYGELYCQVLLLDKACYGQGECCILYPRRNFR